MSSPSPINSGRVPLSLPPLGLGTASLGNLYRAISDETALATFNAALEAGMGLIDTAPHYGQGLSERRVGMALKASNRPRPLISTKVGRVLSPIAQPPKGTERHGFVDGDPNDFAYDYSYDGIMRSFEDSLKRLGIERVDILLGHDLGQATHGAEHPRHLKAFLESGYRAMAQLRSEGRVTAIGLGINEWQICETLLAEADPDIFLLAGRYSLLEQGARASFLPKCQSRGVKVMIGGAYNSGILATGTRGPETAYYNYEPAPPAIIAHVQRLEAVCDAHKVPLPAAALAFVLAHPAVDTIIVGQASTAQVQATHALHNAKIPEDFWAELKHQGLIDADAPTPNLKTPVS